MSDPTCPHCGKPQTITRDLVEAGARAVFARITRRRNSALQLVSNQQDLPIPEALLDDIRTAFEAAFAPAATEAPEGPQG